ncbi:exosortase F system-associated protein [Flavobacterium sp. ov086]|uniref:exosortase F system-associated membrane protein n=1 Tax=Flavobacterium sp. ov086 TaxID=1761785 RepID=UPI000B727AAB|nr:exosortase F system-associated protein [Flavobacterium sp. ov086]SNR94323.1 exosortase F-associated protein [Flavobacterium sp. ov086]
MLDNLKEHKFTILIAILVVFCFGVIRAFEDQLFYDPFLDYFKEGFKNLPFPEVNQFKLFLGLFLRYILNTVLSLVLIYALFPDVEILKFTTFMYGFFLLLLFVMFYVIIEYFSNASWLLFYVRRFIIQPIFVLLFIPAFYYQQQNLKK